MYRAYYPMYFDPTYMLVLIGVVICLAASGEDAFPHFPDIPGYAIIPG